MNPVNGTRILESAINEIAANAIAIKTASSAYQELKNPKNFWLNELKMLHCGRKVAKLFI